MDNRKLDLSIYQIGVVHSEYIDPKDEEQHILYETVGESYIEIYKDYSLGLKYLHNYFSHVFVIYWMNHISPQSRETLTFKPPYKKEYPEVGIFACNIPNRINPIGITPCRILKIEKNKIYLKGLDALDGTPVLDIKPYRPHCYYVKGAKVAPWTHYHHNKEKKDDINW